MILGRRKVPVNCPQCNEANKWRARFCRQCGSPLESTPGTRRSSGRALLRPFAVASWVVTFWGVMRPVTKKALVGSAFGVICIVSITISVGPEDWWPKRESPQRLDVLDPERIAFVDEVTGQSEVWYYASPAGEYELYDGQGFHRSGAALEAADSDEERQRITVYFRAEKSRLEEQRRAQEKEAARKREEERVAAEARAAEQAREAERLRLASYVAGLPRARVNYILFVVDAAGEPSSEVTSTLVEYLARRGISAAGSVFSDAFICPQGFDAAVSGRAPADIVAMRLGEIADRLLLIRGDSEASQPSDTVSGLQTYSMRMTVSVMDAGDGQKLSAFVLNEVTGAGMTETAAKSRFAERFADMLAARSELRAGLP